MIATPFGFETAPRRKSRRVRAFSPPRAAHDLMNDLISGACTLVEGYPVMVATEAGHRC